MTFIKMSPIKYSQEAPVLFPQVYCDLRKLTFLTKLTYPDAEVFNLGFFSF